MILVIASDVFLKGGIQRYTNGQISGLQSAGYDAVTFSANVSSPGQSFENVVPGVRAFQTNSFWRKFVFSFRVFIFCLVSRPKFIVVNHVNLSPLAMVIKTILRIDFSTNVYGLEIWSGLNGIRKLGLRRSGFLIADCENIKEYIVKNSLFDGAIDVLYDPVDVERFRPIPSTRPSELLIAYGCSVSTENIVMTVGRLERNKGHKAIIEALVDIPGWDYVVVGDGSMRAEYQAYCESMGVSDRVHFLGRVHENELVLAYNAADVVALVSEVGEQEGEGLPLGLIEASACGKAILAGNEDGAREAVNKETPNGYVVRNKADLKRYLEALTDKALRERFGRNGRVFAIENFAKEIFDNSFVNILKRRAGI